MVKPKERSANGIDEGIHVPSDSVRALQPKFKVLNDFLITWDFRSLKIGETHQIWLGEEVVMCNKPGSQPKPLLNFVLQGNIC